MRNQARHSVLTVGANVMKDRKHYYVEVEITYTDEVLIEAKDEEDARYQAGFEASRLQLHTESVAVLQAREAEEYNA